jgi:cold shock CspA family protein
MAQGKVKFLYSQKGADFLVKQIDGDAFLHKTKDAA